MIESGAIPAIIHLTYAAQKISDDERRYIARIKELHPHWVVREWIDPVDPSEFSLSHLWPLCRSGAQRADLIRIEAVHNHGGVYLDVDMEVLRTLDDLRELPCFACSEDGRVITNAAFGARQGHPAIKALIDEAMLYGSAELGVSPEISTAPGLFSRVLQFRDDVTILPRSAFYPYNWNENPLPRFHATTIAAHRWTASWHSGKKISATKRIKQEFRSRLGRRSDGYIASLKARFKARAARSLHPTKSCPVAGVIATKTLHDVFVCVDGADMAAPMLVLDGAQKWREELFVTRFLSPGDWFVDAGARSGALILLAAKRVHSFGRVISFAKDDDSAALLQRSALINGFNDRMKIRVADKAGFPALDAALPKAARLRLVRIDVQGGEAAMLRGMGDIVRDNRADAIMIEVVREAVVAEWRAFAAEAAQLLAAGYVARRIDRSGALVAADWSKALLNTHDSCWVFVSPNADL